MINRNSILLTAFALAICVASAEAQEFSIGGLAGSSNRVAGLNDQTSPGKAAVVGKLPKDYFRSTLAPSPAPELESSTSHTTANMLVIAALATMLCIGMTITGLCIMRRRPHSTPARILVSA